MENEMNGLGDLGAGYDMEGYSPIGALAEDYEFFGLDAFVDAEMLKTGLIAGAAGAGGILVVGNVLDRIEYFDDKPKGKSLAQALVGLVGGRLLWQVNRDAAMGFIGGVTGYALATLVNQYIAEMETEPSTGTDQDGLGYTTVNTVPSYMKAGRVSVPAGWRGNSAPMSGLGRDMVTKANYFQIDGAEDEGISSWIGG